MIDMTKAVLKSKIEGVQMLVEIIGAESTVKLMRVYGGTTIYIPQIAPILTMERDSCICSDYTKGVNVRQLALKYHVSGATIRRIINNTKQDEYQEIKSMFVDD